MGSDYSKQPADVTADDVAKMAVGSHVKINHMHFRVAEISSAVDAVKSQYAHFYKSGDKIYYLVVEKTGGARRSKSVRVAPQVILYPEEGLQSKWSTTRKRSEKISVDGRAPVNFLTENIGD